MQPVAGYKLLPGISDAIMDNLFKPERTLVDDWKDALFIGQDS
jgi:hypothetical protein